MELKKLYFLTVLCVIISSFFVQAEYLRTTEKSCSDAGVTGYCLNCKTQVFCNNLLPFTKFESGVPCSGTAVCIEQPTFAYCDTSATVCACPTDITIAKIDDTYNDEYYLVCIGGNIEEVGQCPVGTVHVGNGLCGMPPSTTTLPSTTTPSTAKPSTSKPTSCEAASTFKKYSCTSFYYCNSNKVPSAIFSCASNEIFSESELNCVEYKPFTCADYPTVTGPVRDPYNCRIYYTCSQGQQFGVPGECPPGKYFNVNQCEDNSNGECIDETCTPCSDSTAIIAINCTSYYQCEGTNGDYTTTIKTCPPGFYFDYNNLYCTKSITECLPLPTDPQPSFDEIKNWLLSQDKEGNSNFVSSDLKN